MNSTIRYAILGVIAFVFLFVIVPGFWGSVGTIAAGETGVVTRFGAVQQGDLKGEGLYFVTPFIEKVNVMDTKPYKLEINKESAVTSDRQDVTFNIALIVQVDPKTADHTYDQYRDAIVDTVITPKVLEAAKTVTARYSAAEQVQRRGVVQSDMLSYIQHETQGKGVIIGPGALSITNFEYNPDYQAAIEATAVSQQNAVKARADLAVAKVEAESAVAKAEGEARAQQALARTISDKSLGYKFLEKWDGKLPTVMGGSAGNILNLANMAGGDK
jgi:regulator of protease activity HflC (stomatin/prohibitin superfamily)